MKIRFFIILIIICSAGRAFAQKEVLQDTRYSYITTGLGYQMFRLGGYQNPISQASFPVSILLPISSRVNLTITHTPAMSRRNPGDEIDGLSDTWIQGSYLFWDDKAMVNMGIGIPTGKTRLDSAQFDLSTYMSRNALRFRLPVYGQGLCAKLGVGAAYPVYDYLVVGLGAQYMKKGTYHPVNIQYFYQAVNIDTSYTYDVEYSPGDELSLQLGVDVLITDEMKIQFDGIYTYYWRDLLDGVEVYRSGQKISMNIGYFYRMDKNFIWANISYRHRGKNELLEGLDVVKQPQNSNGFQVDVDAVAKVMDFEGSGILLLGDCRFYGRNDIDERGKALIFGAGFGAIAKLSDNINLDFRFKYLAGKDTFVIERTVEGMDTYLGVTFRL